MGRHKAVVRRRVPRWLVAVGAGVITASVVVVGIGGAPQASLHGAVAVDDVVVDEPSVETPRATSARSTRTLVVAPVVQLKPEPTALPADSGAGRRVVFSQGAQRVWLVEADGSVARTYPVSGSTYDNLQPGSYSVFSRSEQAWGIDDSGTMRNFVRFAHGPNAAIGFHDIPVLDGKPVQTERQLGTPLSHGCVRQGADDALALWDFAPIGTRVVVV